MALVKIVNAEGGSDARYNVSLATPEERQLLDSEGRPLAANLPGQWEWTPGLPGARGGTGPGFTGGAASFSGGGDMLSSAMGSPFYQQVLAANRAAEQAQAAARKAALQQMLIQFGMVPSGFVDKYGDIDQTARNLAEANTKSGISAVARLRQALQDANRDSTRRLTARGLRRSGTRGYQLRRNQLGYDQSFSDAVQKLLSGTNELYSNFAQGQYSRSLNLSNALANALSSLNFSPPSYTPPSYTPPSYSPPPAPAPTYSAPAFSLPSGGSPQIKTGGGYYTTASGDLTSKWQRLAGM